MTSKKKNNPLSLTVVVLNKNQGHHLKELLPQLAFAQVLVVDDYSTDDSKEIVARYGVKLIKHSLENDYAAQRNMALTKVKTKWVLFVDADERVTPELRDEIIEVLKTRPKVDGFAIPRRDVFLGKQLAYGETGHTTLVRLGKRMAGSWRRPVHEIWDINNVGLLRHPLLHHSHPDISSLKRKVETYSHLEANYRLSESNEFSLLDFVLKPVGKFLYTFIYQKGFIDGLPGFFMSLFMSYHSFLVRKNQFNLAYAPKLKSITPADRITVWLIPVSLMLMTLGQLTRITIMDSVTMYSFELTMALGVMFWLISWIFEKRTFNVTSYWISLAVMIALWGLSLVINASFLGETVWKASLYWWRYGLYAVWGYSIFSLTYHKLWCFPWKRMMVYVSGILALFGWLQYLVIPDMRWLYSIGFDEHLNRMVGTLFDPTFLGLIMLLGIIASLNQTKSKNFPIITLMVGGILFTYSRSVYGLTFFVTTVIAVYKRYFNYLAIFLVGFVIAISLLPRSEGEGVNLLRTYSIHSRAFSTLTAWEWFIDRPIFGMGFNAYKWMAIQNQSEIIPTLPSGPDNSYVHILATTGVIGFIAFLIMLVFLFKELWRYPWIKLSITAILVHSLTNNSWFFPWVMVWVSMLLGASLQEVRVDKKQ